MSRCLQAPWDYNCTCKHCCSHLQGLSTFLLIINLKTVRSDREPCREIVYKIKELHDSIPVACNDQFPRRFHIFQCFFTGNDRTQAFAGELNYSIWVIYQFLLAAKYCVFKVSYVVLVYIAETPLQSVSFTKSCRSVTVKGENI